MSSAVGLTLQDLERFFSRRLLDALLRLGQRRKESLYVVGGTVRDLLLGKRSQDLDLAVRVDATSWARELCREMAGGTIVPLSGPEDEAVRVVWQNEWVDISAFRSGTERIEEDLRLRDFTVNAIGLELTEPSPQTGYRLIDPTGGAGDIAAGIIRHLPGAFGADPVRMLRGYRLFAQLGFSMTEQTRQEVRLHSEHIEAVAVERISHELELIFDSDRTSPALEAMAEDTLLQRLLPELYRGRGVEQPEFHHLDVLDHCLLALKIMEEIIADPLRFFPHQQQMIAEYLRHGGVKRCLKWAALMHDVGKPATRRERADKGGRVTFYGHDETGKEIFAAYASRSHWSRNDTGRVSGLISMHMHPFHLCNVQREKGVSKRAALKLSKRAGDDLVGLFLLAMSDSLASKGEKKPAHMEDELVGLFDLVADIFSENIQPVLQGPRLISGKDLIERFGQKPGPEFSVIMDELEAARVEGLVGDRQQALLWVESYLRADTTG